MNSVVVREAEQRRPTRRCDETRRLDATRTVLRLVITTLNFNFINHNHTNHNPLERA